MSFLQSFMYIFVGKKWSLTKTSKNPGGKILAH